MFYNCQVSWINELAKELIVVRPDGQLSDLFGLSTDS